MTEEPKRDEIPIPANEREFQLATQAILDLTAEISSYWLNSKEPTDKRRTALMNLNEIPKILAAMSIAYGKATATTPQPTYSQVATQNTGNKVKLPTGKRITSQPNTKVIIRPMPDSSIYQSSEDTKSAILRLKPQTLGLQVTRIYKAKDNSVIIESASDNNKLIENVEVLSKIGLAAAPLEKFKPRLAIYGVPTGFGADELKSSLLAQNHKLSAITSGTINPKFKFGPKGQKTVHWVVETDWETRNAMLSDRVYVGWTSCRVADHVRVQRCYKCQKYGHNSTDCKSETACGQCSEAHATRDCPNKNKPANCINCIRAKLPEEQCKHATDSKDCPTYTRRLKELIDKTDYGPKP